MPVLIGGAAGLVGGAGAGAALSAVAHPAKILQGA